MAYAGGVLPMIMTSVFYLAGVGFYVMARREHGVPGAPLFSKSARVLLGLIILASAFTLYIVWQSGIEGL